MSITGSIGRSGSGQVVVGQSIPLTVTLVSYTGDPAGSVWTAAYQIQNADRTWGPWQVFANGLIPALTAGVKVTAATSALAAGAGFVKFGLSVNGGDYRASNSLFVALTLTPQLVAAPGDSAIIADKDIDAVAKNIGGATSPATTASCKVMVGGIRNPLTGHIEFADPTWHVLTSVNVGTIAAGASRNLTFPLGGNYKPGHIYAEVQIVGGGGYLMAGAEVV